MKIAHLADVHSGFRRYYRQTQKGINQREADVAVAFRSAIDDVIAQDPDVVVIAGDIFQTSRPNNLAIVEMDRQLRRIRKPILLVAGNHDTAKMVEVGSILPLFRSIPDCHVATAAPLEIVIQGVNFCLVPSAALAAAVPYKPKPAMRNVLVIHAGLVGRPGISSWEGREPEISEKETLGWDYVAMGDWHVAQQVGPTAWYSGSIEYTSTNPWGELKDEVTLRGESGKGWLLVGLTSGGPTVEFRKIKLARRHFDLPPIDGFNRTADELAERILESLELFPGNVVRQVVTNVRRELRRSMHVRPDIKALGLKATHFKLDLRAEPKRVSVQIAGGTISSDYDGPPEQWERDQEEEAKYWDGKDDLPIGPVTANALIALDEITKDNVVALADAFRAIPDPYGL